MKTRKKFLTALGLGIVGISVLAKTKIIKTQSMEIPKMEFAFKAFITLDPVHDIGNTPHGHRRIIPISGGNFEGPNIKGTVVPGGGDWQIVRDDNVAELTAQYTLKTDDGALIYITNKGYRHGPPDVLARLSNGEAVNPSEYYFRAVPFFETSVKKYDYLNRYIYIATGERQARAVVIDFYKIL